LGKALIKERTPTILGGSSFGGVKTQISHQLEDKTFEKFQDKLKLLKRGKKKLKKARIAWGAISRLQTSKQGVENSREYLPEQQRKEGTFETSPAGGKWGGEVNRTESSSPMRQKGKKVKGVHLVLKGEGSSSFLKESRVDKNGPKRRITQRGE